MSEPILSERDSFNPDSVAGGGGPVDCGNAGGSAGGGGGGAGGWWSGGYAAANTTISEDVGDGDAGTAAMDSVDDTSGFGGNSVMSSQNGGERQRPTNWKRRMCALAILLGSIGGLVAIVYAGMAMSNKHNASQAASEANGAGEGADEAQDDNSNGTTVPDTTLVVVPPAPLNLDEMCTLSPSASVAREGRNVTSVDNDNEEDRLAQCTMACLEARCCFAPNDGANCRDRVKGNDEACESYEICRDVLRGGGAGGGGGDESDTTTTDPNEDLYAMFCPEMGTACVDETNLAECHSLIDRGCRDVVQMESCPLQFRCNDSGEDSPSTEVDIPVTIRAQMGRYPQSSSDYEPEGEVAVTIHAHNFDIDLTMEVSGIAPDCTDLNTNDNGCGVHIHEGTDCTDAESVGGHYWNEDVLEDDPWAEVRYNSGEDMTSDSSNSEMHVVGGNGYGAIHNAGRVVIVHDADGSRIACGVLGRHPHLDEDQDQEDQPVNNTGGGVVVVEDSQVAADLADARHVWESNGLSDYDYVFQRSCMCVKDATLPMLVQVRDNRVYSVTYYSTEPSEDEEGGGGTQVVPQEFSEKEPTPVLTMDEMFDLVQGYFNDPNIGSIDVGYDDEYGYPTSFEVDMNPMRSDDEESVSITSLVEVVGGDGDGDGDGDNDVMRPEETPELNLKAVAALSDAKRLWESSGLVNYDFVFQRDCMCIPDYTLPMLVRVRDGQISLVTYVGTSSSEEEGGEGTQVVPQSAVESRLTPVLTVDAMFEHIQAYLDDPGSVDSIEVTYDDEYGFPTSIEIDADEELADDEESASITSLVVANVTSKPPAGPPGDEERPPDDQDQYQDDQYQKWLEVASAALDEAESQWIERGPPIDYDYTYHRTKCSCLPDATRPMRVQVRSDEVMHVEFVDEPGTSVPEDLAMVPTVRQMFDGIRAFLNDGVESLEVEYDTEDGFGYPTMIDVDRDGAVADDEETILVSDLVLADGSDGGGGSGGGGSSGLQTLRATMGRYPDSDPTWDPKGVVELIFDGQHLEVVLDVGGVEVGCSSASNTNANGCGVHIHEGTDCIDAETVGGHYWNGEQLGEADPWAEIRYDSGPDLTSTSMITMLGGTGFNAVENRGHVIVLHDEDGGRIACGVLVMDEEGDDGDSGGGGSGGGGSSGLQTLRATMGRYPDSDPTWDPHGAVELIFNDDGQNLDVVLDVGGVEAGCSSTSNTNANGCGVHIHEGTDCLDAETVGGHYWNGEELGEADPWADVRYDSGPDFTSASMITMLGGTGFNAVGNRGHVIVLHDEDGGRIACGVLVMDEEGGGGDSGGGGSGGGGSSGLQTLRATMGRYPDSDPTWDPHGAVELIFNDDGQNLDVVLDVGGVEAGCSSTSNTNANGCGVHIHEGTDCLDAETVGGHYWNGEELGEADPWADVRYDSGPDLTSTSMITMMGGTGFNAVENRGHVIVLHDEDGGRIACGVLVMDEEGDGGDSGVGGSGGGVSSVLQTLRATMGRYPDSDPTWDPHGAVELTFDGRQHLDVVLDVGGVEAGCSSAFNTNANGCGVHIHEGTDCTDAEAVGGHYWNEDLRGEDDPWAEVRYDSGFDLTSTSMIAMPGGSGFNAAENRGHVIVLHDEDGGRIACGVLVMDEEGDDGDSTPPEEPSPEGELYSTLCPPLGDCVNEDNLAECHALVDNGCRDVLPMESCPMKFRCNDYDGLPTGDIGGEGAAVEAPPRVLRAQMGPYPESTLQTVPKGDITFIFQWNGDVDVKLDVNQVSSECSPEASTNVDGCNVAIYEGESCTERSTIGGHYYDPDMMGGDDPWEGVTYSSKMDSITTSEIEIPGGNGYDVETNVGHVVVIHNKVGSRIACGVLVEGVFSPEEVKDESEALADNQQMWESRGVMDYDYVYKPRCPLCDPRSTQAKKIEVRGGVIASVTYAEDGSTVPEEFAAGVPTIDDLFERVQEYIGRDFVKLKIEYDEEWGYPHLAEFDRDESTADDDEGFTASELKAMFEPSPEEDGDGSTGEPSTPVTLSATIGPYPGSDSDLDPRGDVTMTFHRDGRVDIAMNAQDVEASCSFFNDEPNGCGVHIHEGMNCADAETVGGHYWNEDELGEDDPWADVRYTSGVDLTSTSQLHLPEGNGFDVDSNRGHVIVIHDEGGARIACGVLEDGPASSPGDEGPREDVMMPDEDGYKPVDEAGGGPMKLSAVIGSYPGSDFDLDPRGDVTMTFHTDGRVDIAMNAQDVEASCSFFNDEPNGCGVHIHEGMNCADAETVGGHYWNKDELGEEDDPWADVRYTSGVDLTSTSQLHLPEGNGFDVYTNRGHVVVIHDEGGARIACGVLEEEGQSPPASDEEGREDIMIPNEDGYDPDEDGMHPDGDGIYPGGGGGMNPDEDGMEPKEDGMDPMEDGTNADEGAGGEGMNPDDEDNDLSGMEIEGEGDGAMNPGENVTSPPATGGEGGGLSPPGETGQKSHENPGGLLPWSSELCASLGYADKFDFCGEIEFCEGGGSGEGGDMGYRRRRLLRARKLQDTNDDDKSATYPAKYGWRIPGRSCRWPAPAMRMERGKSYGLFAKGSGTEMETNLHTHGLHIAGHGNSDDILRKLSGNDVIIYNYTIPDHHMGGTFWYHAHRHGQSDTQLRGGALGMLIIEDGDDVGSDEDGVRRFLNNELTMLASNLPGDGGYDDFQWRASFQNYVINADEWYRMRILTVSVDAHQSEQTLSFGGNCEARAIAHDGVFRFEVPAAVAKSEFVLTSASRLDVALRCSAEADIRIDGALMATIAMSGATADSSPTPYETGDRQWSSTRPPYLKDLRNVDVTYEDRWEIKVDETNINGQAFSMDAPLCNDGRDFLYGQVNEWTMKPTMHPLHVHLYHMQIASEGGCSAHDFGEYYDTIYHNAYDYKDTCKVRLHLIDVGGKTVLHCHMPLHQEQGSMGFIQVKGGPVQPDEPRVHSCDYPPCDEPVHVNMCSAGNPEDD